MIDPANILNIIEKMCVDIGISFVREQQPGIQENYPFCSYKILSGNPVRHYQEIREVTDNADPDLSTVTTYRKSRAVVSISFYDRNDVDAIAAFAAAAWNWFTDPDNIEFCRDNRHVCNGAGPVQDRTAFSDDGYYETRFGFDVNFDTIFQTDRTVEKVAEITLQAEADGHALPNITIDL